MLTHFAVPSLLLFILASRSTAQEGETQVATPEEPAFAEATAGKEEKKPPRVYWDNGLWFRPRHTSSEMKIGGQAQIDTAGFVSNDTQPVELEDGVEWRRARIYVLGSFQRRTLEDQRWSFKFQWDFTGGGGPNLTDAWIALDFNLWRGHLRLRGGRFSSTFGLENDASSNDTLFMEQGLTSVFVPPQETGVLLHSNSKERRWDLSFSTSAQDLECINCGVTGISGRTARASRSGARTEGFTTASTIRVVGRTSRSSSPSAPSPTSPLIL